MNNLTSLKSFNCSNNGLTKLPPIENCISIEDLNLSQNSIEELSDEIGIAKKKNK